jgi:hypothetical protein
MESLKDYRKSKSFRKSKSIKIKRYLYLSQYILKRLLRGFENPQGVALLSLCILFIFYNLSKNS